MSRKSSTPNVEEIRSGGIGFASKLVIEHKYEAAKDVFSKLLRAKALSVRCGLGLVRIIPV